MFEAYGTQGLEVFTWVVAAIIGIVGALVTTHVLSVTQEESEEEEEEEETADDKKMSV
jgi:nucleoside permease NupC